jgi:hypothetical protein
VKNSESYFPPMQMMTPSLANQKLKVRRVTFSKPIDLLFPPGSLLKYFSGALR